MTLSTETNFSQAYARDGYVIARSVVDPEMIARAERHVRAMIGAHAGVPFEKIHAKRHWLTDPFYLELARQAGMLDVARGILGDDLALFAAGYIIKAPAGDSPAVLWHQDGSYWPLEPMEVCTLWLAITPSTRANGCMRVVRGTQSMSIQPHHAKEKADQRTLLDTQVDDSIIDPSRVVDLELSPGDVSVHHPNVIHGSNANTSPDQWRLNLVARVIRSSTRVTDPSWPGVFHLCGRRRDDVNRYLEHPAS